MGVPAQGKRSAALGVEAKEDEAALKERPEAPNLLKSADGLAGPSFQMARRGSSLVTWIADQEAQTRA